MGKKKKKVSVNAIDKYIKQIRYRTEFKKPEKTEIRQPKIVITRMRMRRLLEVIEPSQLQRNENETFNIKIPVARSSRKQKVEMSKHDVPSPAKTVLSPVYGDLSRKKKNKIARPDSIQIKKSSNYLKKYQNETNLSKKVKNKKSELISTSLKKIQKSKKKLPREETVKRKTAKKLKRTLRAGKVVKKSLVKPRSTGPVVKTDVERNSSFRVANTCTATEKYLSPTSSKNDENVDMVEEEPLSENQTIQAGNRYDVRQIEKSSLPNVVSNEPCLCEPSNLNMDDISKSNSITNESLIPEKYRSCVEDLKSLTAESITKYIKDNQQYYIDYRKAESVQKIPSNGKRKPKNEFKDDFKCNPFDSSQQIAMYLALREIFHVPAGSFLECRPFFTLLIPEICCQLFAQIFRIKSSFAPKLIKKLYPKRVSPV